MRTGRRPVIRASLYMDGKLHCRYTLSPSEEKPCPLARTMWFMASKGLKVIVEEKESKEEVSKES